MRTYLYYMLILLLGTACATNESDLIFEQTKYSVTFRVQLNNNEEETKATQPGDDSLNENEIKRLDILFYNGENNVYYPADNRVSFQKSGNGVEVSVQFTTSEVALFDNATNYKMVVIANTNLLREKFANIQYSELKQLVQSSNLIDIPNESFLMDGEVNTKLSPTITKLTDVKLKRAAAKVNIQINAMSIPGCKFVSAEAQLYSSAKKTAVMQGNPCVLLDSDFDSYLPRDIQMNNSETFYSYENDWTLDSKKEPWVLLKVNIKNSQNTIITTYYKVRLNYLNASGTDPELAFKLMRNKIYELGIHLYTLGSSDPELPLDLTCNFRILDWTSKQIDVSIDNYKYLVVFEDQVDMYNILCRDIKYASNMDVKIENLQAYYYEFDSNGDKIKRTLLSTDSSYPVIVLDKQNSSINIKTSIPINYVPKEIEFDVQTIGVPQLIQRVKVFQYPPIYVTAVKSVDSTSGSGVGDCGDNIYPHGSTGRTNFTFYTVTTLVHNSETTFVGDPTVLSNGVMVTGTDVVSNNLISPQFVIATQRGITSQINYDCAQTRCKTYRETPYKKGEWRIPTKAEIVLIDRIQDDPKSAVKSLLQGSSYWSAYKWEYYTFTSNSFSANSSLNQAYVRCITDTWNRNSK
ncbi:MAG: fimbrial protein [Tannerellaceae bacterium]